MPAMVGSGRKDRFGNRVGNEPDQEQHQRGGCSLSAAVISTAVCRSPRAAELGMRAYVNVTEAGSRRGYRNPVSVLGLVLFVEILATETSAGRGKTTFTSLPYHEHATTPAIACPIRPAPWPPVHRSASLTNGASPESLPVAAKRGKMDRILAAGPGRSQGKERL